jgi:chemotaxis receptor (MCP) glutamine deamidase CheD
MASSGGDPVRADRRIIRPSALTPKPYVCVRRQRYARGDSEKIIAPGKPAGRQPEKQAHAGHNAYHQVAVSEDLVPEIKVEPDHFDVVTRDVVLVAQLESTFALCMYDAVLESGALIHLRVGPPGRAQDPELTDTSLSTDLLLLDRCFSELRKSEPRAQHWQAKVVGQVQDVPGARERFDGVQSFLSAFLADTNVKLISIDTHVQHVQVLRFRPAMGQVRSEPLAASRSAG